MSRLLLVLMKLIGNRKALSSRKEWKDLCRDGLRTYSEATVELETKMYFMRNLIELSLGRVIRKSISVLLRD